MSLIKYCGILDTGGHCQSCCNRGNLFGLRDTLSGWCGDCKECNIRWYASQIRCASFGMHTGFISALPVSYSLGGSVSLLICRFAGLDLRWARVGMSWRREKTLIKETLTNMVDSDDEYFDSLEAATRTYPLTLLGDMRLSCPKICRQLNYGLPFDTLTVLDVVISFLFVQPCWEQPVSHYDSLHCSIVRVQARDYVLEHDWKKYISERLEWFYKKSTGEKFCKENSAEWRAYRYRYAVWWSKGRRWFWEVD